MSKRLEGFLEKYIIVFILAFFAGGVFLAKFSQSFGNAINQGVSFFIDIYSWIAPLAIFLILAPSLAKLLANRDGRFGFYAVFWMAGLRILACIFAILFIGFIFKFPLLPNSGQTNSLGAALVQTLKTTGKMAYSSPFMIAIWVGVACGILSLKLKRLFKFLSKLLDGLEQAGRYFLPLIPFFMMAMGAYIYSLPRNVNHQIASALNGSFNPHFKFQALSLFGLHLDPNTVNGIIWIYVAGSLLVGLVCLVWHFALLGVAKLKIKNFSIKEYFSKYWLKVYPLLWSTSSEALATPLNLHLTKKHFPEIKTIVRRFVVGMGGYLNINGTFICIFVLGGLVVSMLGFRPSLFEWFLIIPVVFLLGYGVPGIPGELILFAGPIAILLNLPEAIIPIFLALYIGLQMGLPDSFRTGGNSTDNLVCALLLNKTYNKKFAKGNK